MRRKPIESARKLVARAKRALGFETARAAKQRADLQTLGTHVDPDILDRREMWR